MRRAIIQLDEPVYTRLREEAAARQRVSIAAVVRQALDQHLLQKTPRKLTIEDFKSVASGRSKPSRWDPMSVNHDAVLAHDLYIEHRRKEREFAKKYPPR